MQKKYEELQSMKKGLENVLSQGVELYLDGCPATPERIVDQFVKEDTVYMPDFVLNESGALTQIRYDKIMGK